MTTGNSSSLLGSGIPRPAGTLNGTASLPVLISDIPSTSPLASGAINARVVQPTISSGGSLVTILSLTGKGVISFLACAPVDATSRTHRFKVTLDGVVIFDVTSTATSAIAMVCPVIGGIVSMSNTYSTATVVPEPIFFNTSLLVEYTSSLTETAKTNVAYKYFAR